MIIQYPKWVLALRVRAGGRLLLGLLLLSALLGGDLSKPNLGSGVFLYRMNLEFWGLKK
jgi:hypothetical protein